MSLLKCSFDGETSPALPFPSQLKLCSRIFVILAICQVYMIISSVILKLFGYRVPYVLKNHGGPQRVFVNVDYIYHNIHYIGNETGELKTTF